MDSLSISSYRNLELLTLRQNAVFTKNVSVCSYMSGLKEAPEPAVPTSTLSDEHAPVSVNVGLFDAPVMQEGQKLNYLA